MTKREAYRRMKKLGKKIRELEKERVKLVEWLTKEAFDEAEKAYANCNYCLWLDHDGDCMGQCLKEE